jgi:hypothetical protein
MQIARCVELEQIRNRQRELRLIALENQRQTAALQAERDQIHRFEEQVVLDRQSAAEIPNAEGMKTADGSTQVGHGTIEVNYGGDQSLCQTINDGSGITVIITGEAPSPIPPGISTGYRDNNAIPCLAIVPPWGNVAHSLSDALYGKCNTIGQWPIRTKASLPPKEVLMTGTFRPPHPPRL